MPFVEGYVAGLALIVLIGPVLFVLLRITLTRGRAHGLAVASGIFVSDVLAVLLCAFGLSAVIHERWAQVGLAVGGGAILLGLGLRYLVSPGAADPPPTERRRGGLLGSFVQGFLVNFVNPFVFMVWLGFLGLATARHGFDQDLVAFMSGALLGVVTLDVTKVLLAHRIRPWLQPGALQLFFRLAGIALLGFGFRTLWVGLA